MSGSDVSSGDGREKSTSRESSASAPAHTSGTPPTTAPGTTAEPGPSIEPGDARPLEDEPTHIMPAGTQRAMQEASSAAEPPSVESAPQQPGGDDEETRPGDPSYEDFVFQARYRATGQKESQVDPGDAAPPPRHSPASRVMLFAVAVAASGLGGAAGAGAMFFASRGHSALPPPNEAPAGPPPSVQVPSPVTSASAATPLGPSTHERERLNQLAPEERTVAEAVLVAHHRRSQRTEEVAQLGEEMRQAPELVRDPARLRRLREYTTDPATAFAALTAMAALPGPESADLLYQMWVGRKERTEVTVLASELVYSKDVLPKASAALRVALDLRRARECEQAAAVLPRAIDVGDRRSVRVLAELMRYTPGCGPNKLSDCNDCLHHSDALMQAIRAVAAREAPKY